MAGCSVVYLLKSFGKTILRIDVFCPILWVKPYAATRQDQHRGSSGFSPTIKLILLTISGQNLRASVKHPSLCFNRLAQNAQQRLSVHSALCISMCERDVWAPEWRAGRLGAKGLQTLDSLRVAVSEMPARTDPLLWVSMGAKRRCLIIRKRRLWINGLLVKATVPSFQWRGRFVLSTIMNSSTLPFSAVDEQQVVWIYLFIYLLKEP